MAPKTLIDKIEALPPELKEEVEDFVEFLAQKGGSRARSEARRPGFPPGLVEEIGAGRDALLEEHGLIETNEILQDLRESGGR